MGKSKQYIADVVNEEKISETPSVLVAPAEKEGELSPNPAGSGFTKQVFIDDSLPESGDANVIYLVAQKVNGGVVGYKAYKWNAGASKWERVYGSDPSLALENGGQTTAYNENNPPKEAPEKVFSGLVVFVKEPIINGLPLSEYIDKEGGVTQAELQAALSNYYTKTQIDGQLAQKQNNIGASTPSGTANQLVGLDSNGDLVRSPLPEGTVIVDSELDENSTNPVENGVITKVVNQKANVDGNYPTMTVGMAGNLTPYDEESGDDQDEPFSFQATGTANGTQEDFATDSIALIKEKQGNTVVVNQFAGPVNSSYWVFGSATGSFDNGVVSFIANAQYGAVMTGVPAINGHRYFIACNIKTTGGQDVSLKLYWLSNSAKPTSSTGWQYICSIGTMSGADTSSASFRILDNRTSGWDEIQAKDIICIDLDIWFNGDIPQDLLDHPENFYRYYQGSLAYNTGELVNANSRYIKCIGRQQLDEEWRVGYYDGNGDFQADSSLGRISSTNPIEVIPNAKYMYNNASDTSKVGYIYFYDKDMNFISGTYTNTFNNPAIAPANARYLHFSTFNNYGTTYNHDITISLYYEGESGYDQYYPYELLTNNDTGTEVLRSAGSVHDVKKPDGTIIRNVGVVDLGTLNWNGNTTNHHYWAIIDDAKAIPGGTNIALAGYVSLYSSDNMSVYLDNGYINVINNSINTVEDFVAYINGKSAFYELAEPTTEQGTIFSENLLIDDFGSMDFSGTSGVPQGNLIFYPVDYKAFVDTLYDYTDGTPSNVALKSDLAGDKSELQGVDTQLLNAIGGTLRQCLCVKETLDFDGTDFVDLGTLTWSAEAITNCYSANVSGMANATSSRQGALSSKYPFSSVDELSNNMQDKSMLLYAGTKTIYIKDSSYANATAFKNAMKGVLLAYEKASE